ncbi:response regulator transcription factor [Galbibacter marinus]|nr:response regulator transcription factor [Galbibacter marinus]
MFKKVLIAEDIDTINLGLIDELNKSFDFEIHHAKYCDDAILKCKKAILDNEPYDLLISDLSFMQDHRDCIINSGEELAKAILALQPEIKIIIYSIDDRPQKIKSLLKNPGVNGYICKGRESSKEMISTIKNLQENDTYLSPELVRMLNQEPVYEIQDYDISLLKELSYGHNQDIISENLKAQGIHPSSVSSIEKRINKLKIYFKAKNTVHLISQVKDFGLI